MTVLRGWGLSEQHLALDAIVAFVDGELSPNAYDRAASHLARCPACAADAAAQRQARAAVQAADTPSISPRLMQALQSIPTHAELPPQPDGLALTRDGQLVAMAPNGRAKPFGSGPVLGSGTPLGGGQQPLGTSAALGEADAVPATRDARGRRTRQGAGVVFSGLVLGALALMNVPGDDEQLPPTTGQLPLPNGAYGNAVLPASVQRTEPSAAATTEPVSAGQPQVAGHTAPVSTAASAVPLP
ncbi:zf-HC2 domain-containing protein [Saccharopolyspora taberi]|uniref:Putative zinc-finger domain-containing protein n=1 Tax=Saccharopolyspora taberi TaxID=60895 RepID=A0ABN3VL36_9PSEU